jgi:hypothetical protein
MIDTLLAFQNWFRFLRRFRFRFFVGASGKRSACVMRQGHFIKPLQWSRPSLFRWLIIDSLKWPTQWCCCNTTRNASCQTRRKSSDGEYDIFFTKFNRWFKLKATRLEDSNCFTLTRKTNKIEEHFTSEDWIFAPFTLEIENCNSNS